MAFILRQTKTPNIKLYPDLPPTIKVLFEFTQNLLYDMSRIRPSAVFRIKINFKIINMKYSAGFRARKIKFGDRCKVF